MSMFAKSSNSWISLSAGYCNISSNVKEASIDSYEKLSGYSKISSMVVILIYDTFRE